jgi:D-alanyl-D-alanine carboxypeptidase/D-alanyl-D-alanine-endopeptidase (penicillin-binding protein 4)
MKTVFHFICLLLITKLLQAQDITKRLDKAVKILEEDRQMKNGIIGFYVTDYTGAVVYEKNAILGLAVASSQKVITSAASLELLGVSFRYKTNLAYNGTIDNGTLNGNIYIIGNGDPTLGSWRYGNTKEQVVLNKWIQSLKQAGIKKLNGNIIGYDKSWDSQSIPGGWIWDDIGNYYGAGASALNWRENQYDLIMKPGSKEGDKVDVLSIEPRLFGVNLTNELKTGKRESGDNAYIYLAPFSKNGFVRGTIPAGKNSFTISGSVPNPAAQLAFVVAEKMQQQGIKVTPAEVINNVQQALPKVVNVLTLWSPSLDSINYWLLRKSINLYGEALVKTLGYEKKNQGSTAAGLNIIKSFWKSNGVDTTALNITDGSGLSPGNRVTPAALVKVMQYARSRLWFSSFYNALPEINGIKMKSGSIGGVRSFTGYKGNYTFAIVVNNYNGSSEGIVRKMYKVLDVLK